MDSNMNPCSYTDLGNCGNGNLSSKETLKKFKSQLHQREQHSPEYKSKKATEKNSIMRSVSDPDYMNSGYENFNSKRLFNDASEKRLKERRTQSDDVFAHNTSKSSSSTDKLRDFLITHADFLNSLYENEAVQDEKQSNIKLDNLPAELWWVPPLNLPTSRSLPSVQMSSNGYSVASSITSRSKTKRSVEDLRQRVDSVCDLVEAMGILEPNSQDLSLPSPKRSCTSIESTEVWPVPSLKISARSSEVSLKDVEQMQPISYKTVGSQCTVIEPKMSTECYNAGSATLRNPTFDIHGNSSRSELTSKDAGNNATELRSTESIHIPQSSLSVSDLACIHIVNPMLSKLARLCTAQGQQYLTVLEELEKACNDFHNACKSQSVAK